LDSLRRLALALLGAAAGCSASHSPEGADAALAPGDGLDAEEGPDLVACGPPRELAPCRVDSDCRSAYLVCAAPIATIELCRDPDAGPPVNPACLSWPEWSDAPPCPHTVPVTSNVCDVRYQVPCAVDADCGPGITCTGGRCDVHATSPCLTTFDCPGEWVCSAGCGCTPDAPKFCFPPFVEFRCPECPPVPAN
jgi:hypothetical protein